MLVCFTLCLLLRERNFLYNDFGESRIKRIHWEKNNLLLSLLFWSLQIINPWTGIRGEGGCQSQVVHSLSAEIWYGVSITFDVAVATIKFHVGLTKNHLFGDNFLFFPISSKMVDQMTSLTTIMVWSCRASPGLSKRCIFISFCFWGTQIKRGVPSIPTPRLVQRMGVWVNLYVRGLINNVDI